MQAPAPAGGQCRGKPCWRRRGADGLRYKDPGARSGGLLAVNLKPGAAGRARIGLRAKGSNLALPGFPLASPSGVVVQLLRDDDPSTCWEARFGGAVSNGAKVFRAKLPPGN